MREAAPARGIALVRAPRGAARSAAVITARPGQAGRPRRLSETDIGARLLRRLDAAAAHPSDHTMGALRAAVTELVDRMKALDLPLARIQAAVETLLREHGVPRRGPRLHVDGPSQHAADTPSVHERLADWCVGAYRDDAWW